MDLLDSILNSMQKPPSASEEQKKAIKKQKEALEKRQKEEKSMLNRFRKKVEDKIGNFIKEGSVSYLQFEPLEQTYRAIVRDVAETAGLQVFSFGQDGIDRYCVVYSKENGPSQDELAVRRSGGIWNDEKALEMENERKEREQREMSESEEEANRKRKKGKQLCDGVYYKTKYAHLIGEEAAEKAAQKTNMNKSYGEVPSENKKDLRSIEQTMADIQAKKRKKNEEVENTNE